MIYAVIRGWLAGMGAILIEILLAAIFFIPSVSSFPLGASGESASAMLPVLLIAFLEESAKCVALGGISHETFPPFRNAIFKGLLVGIGFALFEICVKILFRGQTTEHAVILGAMSGALLHISTGGILGTAWLSHKKGRPFFLFAALFLLALALHVFYNIVISPALFSRFS